MKAIKKLTSLLICVCMLFTVCVSAFAVEDEFSVTLPSKIYGTVGREMNIYFDNITIANNLKNYQIDVVCDYGVQQSERWTYTPTSAGSFGIKINFYKNYGATLVKSVSSTVVVSAVEGTGKTQKVLIIGDSWTENVYYPAYILNNFNADAKDKVKLIGTMTNWNNGNIRYEGRGGWTTGDYVKASKGGRTNPFYNPAKGTFDLAYYLEKNKGTLTKEGADATDEMPDIVMIYLGINDASQVSADTTIANLKTMIESIHSVSADIKVGIALTPPPAGTQDGMGKINACGIARYQQKYNAFNLMNRYIENFDSKINNVFVIPSNVNIDCVNNYAYEEVSANAYSTVTINRISDNVHPVSAGYQQCADAIYAALKAFY